MVVLDHDRDLACARQRAADADGDEGAVFGHVEQRDREAERGDGAFAGLGGNDKVLPMANNPVERQWFVGRIAAKPVPQVPIAFEPPRRASVSGRRHPPSAAPPGLTVQCPVGPGPALAR
ncbi:MAG TPA: hypothetical protein VIW70_03445 [Rubrivivax sp.]